MSSSLKRLLAIILLPFAVFFWLDNWSDISKAVRPLVVRVSDQFKKAEQKRLEAYRMSRNPVVHFIAGANIKDVGQFDATDPLVQMIMIITENMYNREFVQPGSPMVVFPQGSVAYIVRGESARKLSDACNCYGVTSQNVSVVFDRPDDNPVLILSHELTHQLQYSNFGDAMNKMIPLVLEYQAEFDSVRVTQLIQKVYGANSIRMIDARIPNGGVTMVPVVIMVGVFVVIAVIFVVFGRKGDAALKAAMKKIDVKAKADKEVAKLESKKADIVKKAEADMKKADDKAKAAMSVGEMKKVAGEVKAEVKAEVHAIDLTKAEGKAEAKGEVKKAEEVKK